MYRNECASALQNQCKMWLLIQNYNKNEIKGEKKKKERQQQQKKCIGRKIAQFLNFLPQVVY